MTAAFNTKMTTPTAARIEWMDGRFASSISGGASVDASSIEYVDDSNVTFSFDGVIMSREEFPYV